MARPPYELRLSPYRHRMATSPTILPPLPYSPFTGSWTESPTRPREAATGRLSTGSLDSSHRVKYGLGRNAATELAPQPSDDANDPLNWPRWRKELNLYALFLMVSLVSVMKTAFIPVNAVVAVAYPVSYTAAASLTAVPLVLSAFSGLASVAAAQVFGKRPVYLVSALLLFIGSMWATRANVAFSQFMGARIFQGLGWGAFDVLVLGSIQDTFFKHERPRRIAAYQTFVVFATWGSPLLVGVTSQNAGTFTAQFDVVAVFWLFALPLVVLGMPETAFDRSAGRPGSSPPREQLQTEAQAGAPLKQFAGLLDRHIWLEEASRYVVLLHPAPYRGERNMRPLLQVVRSVMAPTVLFITTASFIPHCLLWGFAQTISLLFSVLPFELQPASLGALMTGPFLLGTVATAWLSLRHLFRAQPTTRDSLVSIAAGSVIATVGILAYGLVVSNSGALALRDPEGQLSFPLLSFLLGLLAVGTAVLPATGQSLLVRSAEFSGRSVADVERALADLSAAVAAWLTLLSGIFVMAMPGAIAVTVTSGSAPGLRATALTAGLSQLAVGASAVVVWLAYGDDARRWDGNVVGLVHRPAETPAVIG